MSAEVVAKNPAFTVFAGDLVEAGFSTAPMNTWKTALNGGTNNGLFEKTFALRGNHDAANLSGWQGFFDFPAVATRAGATNFNAYSTDVVYSFDYGNSHFIVLDVTGGEIDMLPAAQITWMASDLTSAETRGLTHAFIHLHAPPYCVSSSHCPYLTTTGDEAASAFWTAINNHPIVTAIFAGHEHLLTRTLLDSTRVRDLTRTVEQFVSGAAGVVSVDPSNCDYTNRWSWCESVDGYATVDVSGTTATVTFFQGGGASPLSTYVITKPIGDNTAKSPNPPANIRVQ